MMPFCPTLTHVRLQVEAHHPQVSSLNLSMFVCLFVCLFVVCSESLAFSKQEYSSSNCTKYGWYGDVRVRRVRSLLMRLVVVLVMLLAYQTPVPKVTASIFKFM